MKQGIVTGSSRGIGLATVKLLAKDPNVRVIGTSTRGIDSLDEPNFISYTLDLSDMDSITHFVNEIGDIRIDFLVNNAGILQEDPIKKEIDMEVLRKTLEVNLFGTIALTERLLPQMGSNAHIINVTSEWGAFSDTHFDTFHPAYKMSKTALNMYTKLLAERVADLKITVSSFDPGWTQTDMGGTHALRKPKDVAQEILSLLSANVETGQFWHKNQIREW